jgi:hypothetical protein
MVITGFLALGWPGAGQTVAHASSERRGRRTGPAVGRGGRDRVSEGGVVGHLPALAGG